MINQIIKDQLEKVEVAKVGAYDPIKKMYVIPKHTEATFEVNHCYLIRLDKTLLNPNSNDILVDNWNQGSYPKHEYMKVSVVQKLSTNIKVDGLYYDPITKQDINELWSGWLPVDQLSIEMEL